MAEFEMNKLVRDAIPAQMKHENQAPIYHVATGRELQKALLEKLKEEADEALAAIDADADFLGEVADIKEVFDALQRVRAIDAQQLQQAQRDKNDKRGAFDQGYYVETVTLADTSEWADYYRERPLQYREVIAADDDPAGRFAPPQIENGIYQHYKGNYYEVLGVGCHTETREYFVVYRPLYKKQASPNIWIRPYQMFIETIEKDGQTIPRFKKV